MPSKKALAKLGEEATAHLDEYSAAFSTRTKVPRTPEH
jgi:hypothetical protein